MNTATKKKISRMMVRRGMAPSPITCPAVRNSGVDYWYGCWSIPGAVSNTSKDIYTDTGKNTKYHQTESLARKGIWNKVAKMLKVRIK